MQERFQPDGREGLGPADGTPGRVPLFLVLLAVVLGVSLAPLALFSGLTLHGMKSALAATLQERQLSLAASAADRLDAFLAQEGRETVKIGEALALIVEGRGRAPYLGDFLDESVVLARYRPSRGKPVVAMAPDLVLPREVQESLERDATAILEQGAAPVPAPARSALLGGPWTLGPERVLAVTVSAPVQRRGRILGVYQQLVLFERPWQEVTGSAPTAVRFFLLAPDGRVIAQGGEATHETEATVRRRPIVQQFLASHGRSRGARTYEVRELDGRTHRVLGSFASTRHSWGVFAEVDEALVLAPVHQLARDIAFGALLAAGLAVVAALVLGMAISRPITVLAGIAQRLQAGDFSVRAGRSRIREIDALARGFNRMAERIGNLVEGFRTAAREANNMFLGTIRALAEAIDEKDPYTKGHSIRVNRYAVIIGRYMGLTREEIRALHVSSLLHDVGKIGIDDAILKKPAALTPEEYEVMKTHPERGAKIMSRIPQMKDIIPGMRFHHERWSGGGYPLGLKREEIPLQARIIAVADTFDAMTTDRPYQKAFSVEEAVERINNLKGVQLDPQVVAAFNRAYEAGEFDDVGEVVRASRGGDPTPPPAPAEAVSRPPGVGQR